MDNIEIVNLVPKFLNFYNLAVKKCLDQESRWQLWKELYHFAAVPPGDKGQKLARALLDDAWEKYPNKLSHISEWKPNVNEVKNYLTKIKSLLGYNEPIKIVVIYFVGSFENNTFVAPYDKERLALCLPVECGSSDIMLAHELTHIVHAKTSNATGAWERTIAATILNEGLATHVSKNIVPGEQDEHYIEHREGWLKACRLKQLDIIKGIFPYLKDASSETIYKFTFGTGTTNIDRESYFVGWKIVRFLLEEGKTFKEIANIQEKDIPDYLQEVYYKINHPILYNK